MYNWLRSYFACVGPVKKSELDIFLKVSLRYQCVCTYDSPHPTHELLGAVKLFVLSNSKRKMLKCQNKIK